ncbi:putative kynurenine formamidase [Termitomyces sp. T112]|nr:putative kynurenine formamidase [Termitomyces sp. T112]
MEFVDIAYTAAGSDQLRQLDLYLPSDAVPAEPRPLLVFVHGGAWRSEDKRDYRNLARNLAAATRLPVAVPNYRLTPQDPSDDDHFRHPAHAEDALNALRFLTTWPGPPGAGVLYDPHCLYLIGHSCSTHMLSSIFLDSSSISPSLTPPPHLLQAVKTIIMSEGIYDLDLLLSSFPAYHAWFIRPTFGQHDSYTAYSTTKLPLLGTHIQWLIIHSKGDTLVDVLQSEAMYQHLCSLYGDHAATQVHRNTDHLDGEHNDILQGLDYVDIIKDFIAKLNTN